MLGTLIAVGRTSEVFRSGNDTVVKLLHHHIPDHWAAVEASLTEAVSAVGVAVPEVRDVTVIDGRAAIVLEYIEGPSMWELMLQDRGAVSGLVREFIAVQRSVQSAGLPASFPGTTGRVARKIAEVDAVSEDDRRLATEMIVSLPSGAALLHGDLHPGNVLMSPSGPVVIDWFDASAGHPLADVARTELLVDASDLTDRRHLPGATTDQLRSLHQTYVAEIAEEVDMAGGEIDKWRAITALSRIAERTGDDISRLVARWNEYRSRTMASNG